MGAIGKIVRTQRRQVADVAVNIREPLVTGNHPISVGATSAKDDLARCGILPGFTD